MKNIRPISLTILIFSIALIGSYYIYYHFINLRQESIVTTYEKENIYNAKNTNYINNEDNESNVLGILSISKINLKLPFYDKSSKKNNVNKNIEILKESSMPDKKGGTIILAAHSGNSYLGYFKKLFILNKEDEIQIKYKNKEYTYIVDKIYELPKNGQIEINKNINENVLVLTTCSSNSKQLVITSKLLS